MAFDNPDVRARITRAEINRRLHIVSDAYAKPQNSNKLFKAIPLIEDITDERRRATSTKGTLLEPAVNALNQSGIETPQNLGGLEDSLGITPDEIHYLACACHGDYMLGSILRHYFIALRTDD